MPDSAQLDAAIKAGRTDRVREVLAQGLDVNAALESDGKTAIIKATIANDVEMVKVLIAAGADVDARTHEHKFFALQFASNKPEIARLLLAAGAEAQMANAYGQGALYYAAKDDCAEVVAMLLEAGASPTNADMFRDTPLHFAEVNKCGNVLPLLRAAAVHGDAGQDRPAKAPAPMLARPTALFGRLAGLFRPKPRLEDYSTNELIRMLSVETGYKATWRRDDGSGDLSRVPFSTRELGAELNRRGGKPLMQAAHRESQGGRMLEIAWDGIGSWRG